MGEVKKLFCHHSIRKDVTSNLLTSYFCFKQFGLHAKDFFKQVYYIEKQTFLALTMAFWYILFFENNVCIGPSEIYRHSMLLSVRTMSQRIVQRLSWILAGTNCLNPYVGYYFTDKMGNFHSREKVGGID